VFQLLITIIAIALTGLLIAATINYLPWWYQTASHVEDTTRTSLGRLEQAYDVTTRANNGTSPVVTDESDGGFRSNFLAVLKLMPATPGGTSWNYGQHPQDGTSFAGLHYFCLVTTSEGTDEGTWRGATRARAGFSEEQVFVNSGCGATSSVNLPLAFPAPLALTMFVAFTPGISK
jgi:hypothetical protein